MLCWLPWYEPGELNSTAPSQLQNILCASHGTKQHYTQPSGTGTPLSVCDPYFLCSHCDEQILSTNRSHCHRMHCFTRLSLTCSTKQRGSTLKTNTELHPELTANTRTLCTHVSAVSICEVEHRKSNVDS